MTSKIAINSDYLNNKSEIHILPCKIYFNGESDVKSYFSNNIIKNERVQEELEEGDKTEGMTKKMYRKFLIDADEK